MAEKRPLCLYTGNIKQLQPGDTILGAYNATEAGWVVNASAWLVATPGSVKLVNRTVTGSINPVTNGGIKVLDNNDSIVMRTAPGTATDWSYVGVGSACTPQSHLHMNVKGSGANYLQFSNDTTAHGNDSGFSIGINADEQARLWNYENTSMRFATNNLIRMRLLAGGGLHAYYTASVDGAMDVGGALVTRSTASMDGAMDVGGAFVLRSTASLDGAVTAGGALVARNTASFDSTVTVGGHTYLKSTASIADDLYVSKSANPSVYVTETSNNLTGRMWTDTTTVYFGSSTNHPVAILTNEGIRLTVNTDGNTVIANGKYLQTDEVRALDSDGLELLASDGSKGITIRSSGLVHIANSASVDTNLNVGGNLDVTGDLVVTGSLRVVASTLYLGDNQFGNAQTDTQLMYGNITMYNDVAASVVITGNASINGNLQVGGTAGVGNVVTITSDVQVAAGQYLYLDGGLDTYLTASNDIITMHAGTASMLALSENGVALGSAITAPGNAGAIIHGAHKGANSYLQLTNANTGHTGSDGVIVGPVSTSYAYLLSYESPWSIWASGSLVATWADSGLTLANGDVFKCDAIHARDAGGLSVYNNAGTNGFVLADAGTVTFTDTLTCNASIIGGSNASIDGTLDVGGLTTLGAGLNLTGALSVTTTASIGGNTNVHGVFHVHNNASISGTVTHDSTFLQTGAMTAAANVTCNASVLASAVIIGGTAKARLKNCAINASGTITAYNGSSLMLNSLDDTSPDQSFIAAKVWNAVYNDVVDWQDLADDEGAVFGKVYVDSYVGARLPVKRCQKSVIGICSDTFGFAVGRIQNRRQIPVSVAGWCLAYVDKQYESGEPLTNTSSGCLTSMNATEKREYPERLVAIYKRPETEEKWQDKVWVNGRHWVKVK